MVKTVRSEHKIAIRQGDPDPPESVEIPAGIGDRLSVRIGEHIYNLRAALDYLIYELSGHKRQTQFPVEKDRNSFNSRKTATTRQARTSRDTCTASLPITAD